MHIFMLGNKVPQSVYAVGQSYKPNDVLKYHKNSRKLEENRNHLDQVKLNISGKSTDKTKSYNVSIKQPPVHLKRKVSFYEKQHVRQIQFKTVVS